METFQCLTNYELQCMNPEPIQWAKDVIAQSCEISSKLGIKRFLYFMLVYV